MNLLMDSLFIFLMSQMWAALRGEQKELSFSEL